MLVLFIYILNVRNIAKKLLCFKLKIVVLKACTCFLGGLAGDFGWILQSQMFIGIFYNIIWFIKSLISFIKIGKQTEVKEVMKEICGGKK